MKRISHFIIILTCIGITMLFSCSSKENKAPDPEISEPDRKEMLIHIADEIVIPSYNSFKVKFDDMVAKSDTFAKNPTATSLLEFRQAWQEAYIGWQKVELFDFGPGEKHVLRSFFNIYPASEQEISSNIQNPNADLEVTEAEDTRGFPALDYLLNGVGSTDETVIAFYTSSPDADKNIAYLKRLITQMNSKFTKVYDEWNGGYRNTFVSKTGTDLHSSLGLVVNGYVRNYERYIRSGKFGVPSGAMAGGVKNASKVEAFYKRDISKTLAKVAHQASIDFFNGKSVKTEIEGPSIKSYLNTLKARDVDSGKLLSEAINDQFNNANGKIDLLGSNFYNEVQNNNQKMIDVYLILQKAVGFLKVDMTSAMSITINYNDNDGD